MTEPKHKNYRKTSSGRYELHKYCPCEGCKTRHAMKREPSNQATAYTSDKASIDKVAAFLDTWTCSDGTKILDRAWFYF